MSESIKAAPSSAGSPAAAGGKPKRPVPAIVKLYLVVYNLVSAAAWGAVLALTVNELFVLKTPIDQLYSV